jgi:myo-inositol-1(or 4)-monophosphatase
MFYAAKGEGAYLNGNRIQVSSRTLKLADVNIRASNTKPLEREIVSRVIEKVFQVKNNMCCHDEISGIACGRYDGLITQGSHSWDYCHYLLVTEAGGQVTDWKGVEFDLTKGDIVVSNGIIHQELLAAIKMDPVTN